MPVEVLMNNDKVEVRPHGISKGDTLDLIMEELGYRAAVKEDIESSSQVLNWRSSLMNFHGDSSLC